MPKMIIIECSDEEADRMVEQLKNMVAEYEYHPYHGPGKLYESVRCGSTSPNRR